MNVILLAMSCSWYFRFFPSKNDKINYSYILSLGTMIVDNYPFQKKKKNHKHYIFSFKKNV